MAGRTPQKVCTLHPTFNSAGPGLLQSDQQLCGVFCQMEADLTLASSTRSPFKIAKSNIIFAHAQYKYRLHNKDN